LKQLVADEGQVEKEEDEEVEAQKAKDEGQIQVDRSSLHHLNIFEAEPCITPKSTTTTNSSKAFIEVASLTSVQDCHGTILIKTFDSLSWR